MSDIYTIDDPFCCETGLTIDEIEPIGEYRKPCEGELFLWQDRVVRATQDFTEIEHEIYEVLEND